MTDDPASAALAAIRADIGARDDLITRMQPGRSYPVAEFNGAQDRLAERVPSLLAAVERVLELHRRRGTPVRTHRICAKHAPWGNDEGHTAACPDCTVTEKWVCAEPSCRCWCPDDDGWPCPTVRAITAALAGDGESEPSPTEADRRAADEALTALRDRLAGKDEGHD